MPYSSADPNSFVGLAVQSALGTPNVTAAQRRFVKGLSGISIEPVSEVVDLRETGDGLDYGFSYKQRIKAQGQLVMNARPEITSLLLAGIVGGATWSGASAPAAHTFHTGHASFPWFTIVAQHPGSAIAHLISDVRFTGLTIEWRSGEPVMLTAPFVAITPGASMAAVTPTVFQEEPYLFHVGPSYVIDGSADSDVTGVRVSLELGVEELQSQAITLDEIVVQNRTVDVEISRRFEDPTLWKKVHYGGGVAPTTSVATGSLQAGNGYGSGAGARALRIDIPLLSYRGQALAEIDPDGRTVTETISARALRGATHLLVANLTNSHASALA